MPRKNPSSKHSLFRAVPPEGTQGIADAVAAAEETRKKTQRLKALRLARDAGSGATEGDKKERPSSPKKSPEKASRRKRWS
jgi:hypothetical protein